MALHNVAPLSVDQVMRAMSALGQEVVADPEFRPDGPTDLDLPELIGGLLGRVEHEVATIVDPTVEPSLTLNDLQDGWRGESDDPEVHRAVLINRLQRTAFDIDTFLATETEEDDDNDHVAPEPPGPAGAAACALAGADLLTAQEYCDSGRTADAHLALDAVEGALGQALIVVHLLRRHLRPGGAKD